ncbi:hypothetical protein [Leifsonia sp. Leaf264]|uniref:hypothetical protein n=1 Tax=Leifsonia sp. Leaf264 TaxID=1736314 RepID=UPI0006F3B3C4|nr:hypothetical protein [Leifsonia sp. Leaf264]KQO98493.1 hypothetical protein ASF30_10550 [Leifsonia sp. Leaf264]
MTTTAPTITAGTEFRSIEGDENVLWKVTDVEPSGMVTVVGADETIEVEGEEFYSDYAGVVKRFPIEFVQGQVAREKALAGLFTRSADETKSFWDSMNVGDVLHYNDRRDSWIRGVVALTADGKKGFKGTALVGERSQGAIYSIGIDGTVHHGYDVRKILNGDIWVPRKGDFFEYASNNRSDVDPRTLPVLPLHPPAPTAEQAAEYALGGQTVRIRAALDDTAITIEERLALIRSILDGNA